jgi:hypothetical protein
MDNMVLYFRTIVKLIDFEMDLETQVLKEVIVY